MYKFIKPFLDWKWNRFRIRELVKVYFGRYVIKIGQKCTPMHFWDSHDLSWPHSDHLYHHCSSNFWIIVFHTLFSWRKFIFQSMPPSTTQALDTLWNWCVELDIQIRLKAYSCKDLHQVFWFLAVHCSAEKKIGVIYKQL